MPDGPIGKGNVLGRVVGADLGVGLSLQPLVSLFLRHFFRNAVALLQAAHKLFLASGHKCQVVVGELAPLLPGHALHLLPLPFHLIPIHVFRLALVLARACPEYRCARGWHKLPMRPSGASTSYEVCRCPPATAVRYHTPT